MPARNLQQLVITDEWKEWLLAKIEIMGAEDTSAKQTQIERLRGELAVVKPKIERLNTAFTDGSIELSEFKELKNPLVAQKVELEAKIIASEKTKTNQVELLKSWIIQANSSETRFREEISQKCVLLSQKGRVEQRFSRPNLNRFFQKTLGFIGPHGGDRFCR